MLPQKTNPAPPLTHGILASSKAQAVRPDGPHPIHTFKNKCQETDLSVLASVPTFAQRKCRYQVRRETPRVTHGAWSCSSGVPARRASPDTVPPLRPRAACFQSQPCS